MHIFISLLFISIISALPNLVGAQTSVVDLVVYPHTTTPDFYKGSPLPSPGSTIEIVATPFLFSGNTKLNPNKLIYTWTYNGLRMANASGLGKNKLVLKLPDIGGVKHEIIVAVSSSSGSVKANKIVSITTTNPHIAFHETNNLTGKKLLSFNSYNFKSNNSYSIISEPYFYDPISLEKAEIIWRTGKEIILIKPGENPFLLNLTIPDQLISNTFFSLNISNKDSIFQNAKANLNISTHP
jgi:hypothetical protein